jgi:hypothetical protein
VTLQELVDQDTTLLVASKVTNEAEGDTVIEYTMSDCVQ